MYVKKLVLENVGPISSGEFDFPFNETGNPAPVVLVGQNGSGKSIALSFIVNALLSARQEVFEDKEVEEGKVYKYRSPAYIRAGQHYYFGQVVLEQNFEVTEWQLDRTREDFEKFYHFTPSRKSWASIPVTQGNHFSSNFGDRRTDLEKLLNENCFLYFPPNRFEEPAWLNYDNLVAKARFTELKHLSGYSNRQSIQYAPLALNKDWILDVLFDRQSYEARVERVPLPNQANTSVPLFLGYQGPSATLYQNIIYLLRAVLRQEGDLRLGIGPRQHRNVSLMKGNDLLLPNIFQLSTGESLVLNVGLSILRDFDLCRSPITTIADIRGLVVIDEVDLHLHAEFQYTILPQLLQMFPKIQFLITSHSPLFLMGMQKVFGKEGFVILAMPEVIQIDAERFAEFEHAYQIYRESASYSSDLDAAVRDVHKPALFLEGSIDIRYLTHASKLLGEEALVQRVSLLDGEGFGNLDKVWKHFDTRLSAALPRTVVLVYDCDVRRGNMDKGALRRRVLSEVPENPVRAGIENLFSRETLARAKAARPSFFDITPSFTKQIRGNDVVIPEVWAVNQDEKANLCDWLCEHGTADDFRGFDQLLNIIREVVPTSGGP